MFKTINVIETDDEGFLVLKGIVSEGSIEWSRSVKGRVIVKLSDDIDTTVIAEKLISLYNLYTGSRKN